MNGDTHIIYRKGEKWISEYRNGAGIKRTEHTSKTRAFNYFLRQHPGVTQFVIAILPKPEKENQYVVA